jgi:Ser/Thr protein kinase RdoA (MazF antagonist)
MAKATEIESVLRLYVRGLHVRRCKAPPGGEGFSGAVIRFLDAKEGVYCLRGWPRESPEPDRIRGLHRLLACLAKEGIASVAVPIRDDQSRTLVLDSGRYWQVEPWKPGRADFWSDPREVRLIAAMHTLATIHRAAATFDPALSERTWFFSQAQAIPAAVSERSDRLQDWNAEALARLRDSIASQKTIDSAFGNVAGRVATLFERCAPHVADELKTAHRLRVPVQACLRDIWHDHVLFVGDDVTGIIDPSAARADSVAADISRLVGSLVGDCRRFWDLAIEAYHEIRPLSGDERILVTILDRSGVLLSGMTWLERRYFRGMAVDQSSRVLHHLERIAERLQSLADSIC